MSTVRWGISVVAVVGLLAAAVAAATIWLLLTDPITVSDSVSRGDITTFVQALGAVIYEALRGVFRYL